MKFNFTGTGVALVTPFHKNGNIDFYEIYRDSLNYHLKKLSNTRLQVMLTT